MAEAQSRNLLTRNPVRGRFIRDGDPAVEPASILCLPNVISIIRILAIPVFLWLLLADALVTLCTASMPPMCGGVTIPPMFDAQYGPLRLAAAILFILAIATDALDGHLARSRRLVTDLGIFLDPIADKGITGAALVGLAIVEPWPWFWWPAVLLVLVREWGITWWRAARLGDRVIPAGQLGKIKTLVQGFAISVILLPFAPLGDWVLVMNVVLMSVIVVITLWSGIDYLVQARRADRRAAPDAA